MCRGKQLLGLYWPHTGHGSLFGPCAGGPSCWSYIDHIRNMAACLGRVPVVQAAGVILTTYGTWQLVWAVCRGKKLLGLYWPHMGHGSLFGPCASGASCWSYIDYIRDMAACLGCVPGEKAAGVILTTYGTWQLVWAVCQWSKLLELYWLHTGHGSLFGLCAGGPSCWSYIDHIRDMAACLGRVPVEQAAGVILTTYGIWQLVWAVCRGKKLLGLYWPHMGHGSLFGLCASGPSCWSYIDFTRDMAACLGCVPVVQAAGVILTTYGTWQLVWAVCRWSKLLELYWSHTGHGSLFGLCAGGPSWWSYTDHIRDMAACLGCVPVVQATGVILTTYGTWPLAWVVCRCSKLIELYCPYMGHGSLFGLCAGGPSCWNYIDHILDIAVCLVSVPVVRAAWVISTKYETWQLVWAVCRWSKLLELYWPHTGHGSLFGLCAGVLQLAGTDLSEDGIVCTRAAEPQVGWGQSTHQGTEPARTTRKKK